MAMGRHITAFGKACLGGYDVEFSLDEAYNGGRVRSFSDPLVTWTSTSTHTHHVDRRNSSGCIGTAILEDRQKVLWLVKLRRSLLEYIPFIC